MTFREKFYRDDHEGVPEMHCPKNFYYDEYICPGPDVYKSCIDCWDREMPMKEEEEKTVSEIKDSGARREFSTGAVRDISEWKGRCDLLPLDVVADLFGGGYPMDILTDLDGFVRGGAGYDLLDAIRNFCAWHDWTIEEMLLEVSVHFEQGAKKYAERNWELGIPLHCYIDSAVRHFLKVSRGDTDERHDRAFCWNLLCALWTLKNKPELDDLPHGEKAVEE